MKAHVSILVVMALGVALLAAGCDVARPVSPLETPSVGKPTNTPRILVSTDATATALAALKSPSPTMPVPGTAVSPAATPVIPTAAPPGTPIVPTAAPGSPVAPTAAPAGPIASPAAGETVYVVKYGDTLSGIAWRYGTTVEAIAQRNGITNPRLIYVGQRLIIPTGGGQPSPGGTVHIVQPGETMWSIAQKYGTTVTAIAQANGIANPRLIYVGQRLVIPKN